MLLFASMLMSGGALSALEITSDAEAVNIMGKLRMLTWRMLKDHVMIGMNSTYNHPEIEIQKTVSEFDENLKALNVYVKDPEVKKKLQTIGEKWQSAQASLATKATLSDTKKYYDETLALKEIANDAVNIMSEGKNSVIGKAGRLRAVSQALSAIYSLKTWGMKDADKALASPMKRFRTTLDFLKKDSATGPEMTAIIQKLEKTYLFFQMMRDAETMTPSLAIKKAKGMLKDADALTQLYVNKLK